MMFFIEEVIVEFAVTLTLGAVFGFMSGLVTTTPQQADRRDRLQGVPLRLGCNHRGPAGSRPRQQGVSTVTISIEPCAHARGASCTGCILTFSSSVIRIALAATWKRHTHRIASTSNGPGTEFRNDESRPNSAAK